MSPAQAQSLSPEALGKALLLNADVPVVEATVGPQGMEPPPPPGPPVPTRIKLYLRPTPSAQTGFCQQRIATLFLKPTKPVSDGTSPGWVAGDLSSDVAYRWSPKSARGASGCSAPRTAFFTPRPAKVEQALQVVRLLASASYAARHKRKLGFPIFVEDQLGPEMLKYQLAHPALDPIPSFKIISDAREALAALPIETITFVGPASSAFPDILKASDLETSDDHSMEPMTVFLGGEWTVGLLLERGRITRLRLRRAIPPPF